MNNSEFKQGQEVWVKFKIKNPNINRNGGISLINEGGWVLWTKPEEIMTAMPEKTKSTSSCS